DRSPLDHSGSPGGRPVHACCRHRYPRSSRSLFDNVESEQCCQRRSPSTPKRQPAMPESDEASTGRPAAPRTPIQSIDRAIALLDAVADGGPHGTTLGSLAETSGLAPSTARTILASLVAHGLV